jgi:hypothetical protein
VIHSLLVTRQDDIMLYAPLFHGAAGILDELLLFGAPLLVVLVILIINSRRARANNAPRERERTRPVSQPEHRNDA